MVNALHILIVHCIFLGAALQVAGQDSGEALEDGLALITTCKGEVILKSPAAGNREAKLHHIETLSGIGVSTGENDLIFLALSNGTGLGIYKNSKVHFENYLQKPFAPAKESLDYEATRSNLIVRLDQGSISFTAEEISPLSEFIIKLSLGEVKVQGASGRISHDQNGLTIIVTKGIVNYQDANKTKDEVYISCPNVVHPNVVSISKLGAASGKLVKMKLPDSDPSLQLTRHLVKATHRASERVVFRPPAEDASIPRPILVTRPEDLLKPSPRPYNYLD